MIFIFGSYVFVNSGKNKRFCVHFSSNTILVLVVNSPVDYYVAGLRTNLPNGWSHTVSDLRMANIPTAGLCINIDMGGYSWPITAIVGDGGFIHLTGLHEGMPPTVWTWANHGGRFYPRPTRMWFYFGFNLNFPVSFHYFINFKKKLIIFNFVSIPGSLQPNHRRRRTRFNVDRFVTGYLFQWLVRTTLGPYFTNGDNWRNSIWNLYTVLCQMTCYYMLISNKFIRCVLFLM